jgi:hypothetical protein
MDNGQMYNFKYIFVQLYNRGIGVIETSLKKLGDLWSLPAGHFLAHAV